MSDRLLEPELASQVEQLFVAGESVLAFPRGRHAQLAAARPRATAVVEVSRAPHVLARVPGDVELVLLDDGAFAPAARLAHTLPNAILYRPALPLSPAALRTLGARLAHGAVVALAHEHSGASLAAALASTSLAVRRVAVLSFAGELLGDPELLAAWGAAVTGEDDISLVVAAAPEELETLAAAIDAAGLGAEGTADLLAVPASEGDVHRIAGACRAVYSRRAADLGLPLLGPEPGTFATLRAWAREGTP